MGDPFVLRSYGIAGPHEIRETCASTSNISNRLGMTDLLLFAMVWGLIGTSGFAHARPQDAPGLLGH